MKSKIGVLLGGLSEEREVSLRTGEAIYQALKEKGYNVVKIDVNRDICEKLKNEKIDLAFIALHGKYGEDGTIQGLLEVLDIPYTGSGVLASSLSINKIMTKRVLQSSGIQTADFWTLNKKDIEGLSFNIAAKELLKIITLPVVVKAPTQGSSIGITFVHKENDLPFALEEAFKYDDEILVERFVSGKELTASILGNQNPIALPLIEIVSNTGVYDYEAKYTVGLSEHLIPPRIGVEVQEKVKEIALKCYQTIGCLGLARVDFMVDDDGNAFVIEVNTIPGMTETSLFPDAARAANINFPDLVEIILNLARKK